MTARDRLESVRRAALATIAVRALLWSGAVTITAASLLGVAGSPRGAAWVVGAAMLAWGARPIVRGVSLQDVALWVEARQPALGYALVSAVEGGGARVQAQALSVAWWPDARRRLARAMALPLAAFIIVVVVAWLLPARVDASPSLDGGRRAGASRTAAVRDPLTRVTATVTPPAYAGRGPTELDEPTSIDALVGSRVQLSGRGSGVSAALGSTSIPVVTDDGWSATLRMPAVAGVVRLRAAGARDRLVVLAPVTDAPPVVTLRLPMRDTIVQRARGVLQLSAVLRDDLGLRDAWFELVVSSGGGENFTFRTGVVARAARAGAEGVLETRLSLDSLALQPGDVLQVRAVARDRNDVTGPGTGGSETRALRVARAGEYDSVAVEAAPPGEAEEQVLSQRMLIDLAEAVHKRRRALPRASLVLESRRIAVDQGRLRRKVGDVVFQRAGGEPLGEHSHDDDGDGKLSPEEMLKHAEESAGRDPSKAMDVEGDETPILGVNRPLLEAYNAMWEASRALELGEPGQALPPMRRALAAIQRARNAERIYLRGRPSAVIVDVARARLAGKDKGSAGERETRPPSDRRARARAERFERATLVLARDPLAAADTLLLMRVDAIGDAPMLAAALDDAARAVRRGRAAEVTTAWARVRRALAGAPVQRAGLGAWDGVP